MIERPFYYIKFFYAFAKLKKIFTTGHRPKKFGHIQFFHYIDLKSTSRRTHFGKSLEK